MSHDIYLELQKTDFKILKKYIVPPSHKVRTD